MYLSVYYNKDNNLVLYIYTGSKAYMLLLNDSKLHIIPVVGQSAGATHPSLYSTIPEGQVHPILQASGQTRGGLSLLSHVRGHMVPHVEYTLPFVQAI